MRLARLPRSGRPAWKLLGGMGLVAAAAWAALAGVHDLFVVPWDEARLGLLARSMFDDEVLRDLARMGTPALHLLGVGMPLRFCSYRGPWESYTAAVFIRACADPVSALRLHAYSWTVAGACSAAWLAWVLTRRSLPALLCGLALAVSPGIVMRTQWGVVLGGVSLISVCACALGLLVLASRGSRAAWLASSLLAGLSVGLAPQGMGFLVAWLACVYWLRKDLSALLRGRSLAAATLLLCVGPAPLVLGNCVSGPRAWKFLYDSLVGTEPGVQNAEYFDNLFMRLGQWTKIWEFREGLSSTLARFAWNGFFAACAGLQLWAFPSFIRGAKEGDRVLVLPLFIVLCVLALSPWTLSSLREEHLVYLLPFAFAVVAVTPLFLARYRDVADKVVLVFMGGCILAGLRWCAFVELETSPCLSSRKGGAKSIDLASHSRWVLGQRPQRVFFLERRYFNAAACHYLGMSRPPGERPATLRIECAAKRPLYARARLRDAFRKAADGDYLVHARAGPWGCQELTRRDLEGLAAGSGKFPGRETREVYPCGSEVHEIYRISASRKRAGESS